MSDSEDDLDDGVTPLFKTITKQAEKYNFDIEDEKDHFVAEHGPNFTKLNGHGDSILHYMVKKTMREDDCQHRLLKLLLGLEKGPALLNPNDDKETPLHLVMNKEISRKTKSNQLFVDTVLTLLSSDSLKGILEECDSSLQNNCLHYAIKNQFPSAMSLIQKCPASLFTQQNIKGETPLHLAMELTIKGNRAPPKVADPTPLPRRKQDAGKWWAGNDAKDSFATTSSEVPPQKGEQGPALHGENVQNHKKNAENIANGSMNGGSGPSKPALKPAPSRTYSNLFYLPDVVKGLLRDPAVARDTLVLKTRLGQNQNPPLSGSNVGPYQSRINHITKQALKLRHTKQESGDSPLAWKDVEQDPIVRFIKDYCLRNLEREDVIRILYEKDEGTSSSTRARFSHAPFAKALENRSSYRV